MQLIGIFIAGLLPICILYMGTGDRDFAASYLLPVLVIALFIIAPRFAGRAYGITLLG